MNDNKKSGIFVLIVAGLVFIAVIFMMLASKTEDTTFGLIGMGLFVFTVIGAIIASSALKLNTKQQTKPLDSAAKPMEKYQPLLMNERTKQDPEVQRLLQYTSVQKAFFDPDYILLTAAQNDPYVKELLAVFDRMLGSSGEYGDISQFSNPGNITSPNSVYVDEVNRRERQLLERGRKRPRRKVSMIVKLVGMLMFFAPFLAVLFPSAISSYTVLIALAPLGFVLVIVGNMIKK